MATPMALTTLIKAASLLALVHQVSGACYRPDGVDRNSLPWVKDNDYQPCNKGGGHSMCCSTVFSDSCRPNGLCYNSGAKLLWRESCTDPTWKDPACIKLCAGADQLNEEGKSMASGDMVITICGDNSLCCGSGDFAQRCCDAKKGFKILSDGKVVEAYPEPKATTPAPKPTTAAQKNDPTPTPKPADPSPNTGSGSGGGSSGGVNNNNNGGSGGGSTNNGDRTGDSNGGGSGGSGGNGGGGNSGNDNDNGNGNGGSGSPALSAVGADSTPDPKSDGADDTESGNGGQSSSTPKDSPSGDDTGSNSGIDGSSSGKGTGNKDAKDSPSSTDENDNSANSGGSSGDNRNGNSKDNSGGGSGTTPSGGSSSSGAVIGGVVGGVLGGLILFAVAAWFVVRRRHAMKGGYAANRLDSASELPGTDGRPCYEVPGDHKQPPMPAVEQVAVVQDKVIEPSTYHEMEARSPVLVPQARYS